MSAERPCACGCGAFLTGRRPQTRFASEACRKRAERAAHRPVGEQIRDRLAAMGQAEALGTWRGLEAPDRAELVETVGLERDEGLLAAIIEPRRAAA